MDTYISIGYNIVQYNIMLVYYVYYDIMYNNI